MISNTNTNLSLSILLWNSNGVKNHVNKLYYLLHNKNIDIALITETHLTSKSKLKCNGYVIIRADHPDNTSHAGSAILIKSSMSFNELPSMNQLYLQAASMAITLKKYPCYDIISLLPPGEKITESKLQTFFQKLGNHFIIGGDFNSKHTNWGSRYTNTRGRILEKSISKNNISFVSPDSLTYWPTHSNRFPDILDFFFKKIPRSLNTQIISLNDLSSDHTPVVFNYSIKLWRRSST